MRARSPGSQSQGNFCKLSGDLYALAQQCRGLTGCWAMVWYPLSEAPPHASLLTACPSRLCLLTYPAHRDSHTALNQA